MHLIGRYFTKDSSPGFTNYSSLGFTNDSSPSFTNDTSPSFTNDSSPGFTNESGPGFTSPVQSSFYNMPKKMAYYPVRSFLASGKISFVQSMPRTIIFTSEISSFALLIGCFTYINIYVIFKTRARVLYQI